MIASRTDILANSVQSLQAGELPWDSRKLAGSDGEYEFRMARTIEERKLAWGLVYQNYKERGYVADDSNGLWYGSDHQFVHGPAQDRRSHRQRALDFRHHHDIV